MEMKDLGLKIKSVDADGTFVGLASTYGGEPDLMGDVVERGAFKRSIDHQGDGYPLLWAHDQSTPVGLGKIEDSAAGLIVHGELITDDDGGARAYKMLQKKIVRGLSIGFTNPNDRDAVKYTDTGRILRQIRLHEVSLVAIPANPSAVVSSVKSLGDARLLLLALSPADLDEGVFSELDAIDRELKRLLTARSAPEADNTALLAELRELATDLRM
jgi:HK97 family phage prohead protease